jgi:sphingomyelin phosphodiesterase
VKLLAELGDAAFVDAFTEICVKFKLQDEDVCQGVIAQEGPIVAHSLREISPSGGTATKLCDALLGLCEPPKVQPFTLTFPKSASAAPSAPISSGNASFQIVHMSDVHIDREYTVSREIFWTRSKLRILL